MQETFADTDHDKTLSVAGIEADKSLHIFYQYAFESFVLWRQILTYYERTEKRIIEVRMCISETVHYLTPSLLTVRYLAQPFSMI